MWSPFILESASNGHLICVGMILHFRVSRMLPFMLVWSSALKNSTYNTCMYVPWPRELVVLSLSTIIWQSPMKLCRLRDQWHWFVCLFVYLCHEFVPLAPFWDLRVTESMVEEGKVKPCCGISLCLQVAAVLRSICLQGHASLALW